MKRILKVLLVLLLLVVITAVAVPYFFKDRIVQVVKDNVNETLDAKVDFGDFDLSIIRSFPDLNFRIDDITVDGVNAFDSLRLARIGSASFTLDAMSVIKGEKMRIQGISIDELYLNAVVLEDGSANYDIIKESAPTEAEASSDVREEYVILLEKYALNDAEIIYDNQSLGAYIHIKDLDHSGDGSLTDKRYDLNTLTEAAAIDIIYEGTTYLKKADAEIKALFDIQDDFREYNLKENEIRVNGLYLQADGQVLMPEDGVDMDIDYRATRTDLKTLLSLIPAEFMPDLEGLTTEGNIDLSGGVKGHYSDSSFPGFTVRAQVNDGRVQYPDLPKDIDNIAVQMLVDFPGGGTDFNTTKVDIEQFHLDIAGNPIDGNLSLRQMMTDPYIKSKVNSRVDLSQIKEAIALPDVKSLNGIITADVDVDGRLSAIEQERYQDFKAAGQIRVQDMDYASDSLPVPVHIDVAQLNINPHAMELAQFSGTMGRSDISASGSIDNYLGYALKDELLKGRFKVSSTRLNMNEFLGEEPAAKSAGSSEKSVEMTEEDVAGVIPVPSGVDVLLDADVKTLLYENIELKNVRGQVEVKDQKAQMNNVTMEMLGGRVGLDGSYDTSNESSPLFDFGFDISKIDIPALATTFNTVERLMPIAKKAVGTMDTKFRMSSALDANMNPVFSSLTGGGKLKTDDVQLVGMKVLTKMAEALKIDKLQKQKLEDIKTNFRFEDGKVMTDPFDMDIDGMDTRVGGSMSFEQDLDYDIVMKVPIEKLGGQANAVLSGLSNKAGGLGFDVAAVKFVNVQFKVTGKATDPQVRPIILGKDGVADIKETIINTVKEEAEEKIEEVKEEVKEDLRAEAAKIITQAQKQADALRAEAGRAADRVKTEGYRAADKLIEEAKGPLQKRLAKIPADKLRKESDEKAQKIRDEADAKAKDIMAKAQKKADDLLK